MNNQPVTILMVEDDPGDARLLRELLQDAGGRRFDLACADQLSSGLTRLEQGGIDVLLLDLFLPDSQGLETFFIVHRHSPRVPVVVLTGFEDESIAMQTIQAGAQDYLVKGQVDGQVLMRALRYAIERQRARAQLEQKTIFVQVLQDVAVAANQADSIEAALRVAVGQICSRIGWPVGHAYLAPDNEPYALVSADIWYLSEPGRFETFRKITEAVHTAALDDLPGRVLVSGKAEWTPDMSAAGNVARAKVISDLGVRTGFAFPVLVGAEVAAVLEFFSSEAVELDAALLEVMSHVGTQLGRVVERARAGEALEQAERRYRDLFEEAPDMYVITHNHAGKPIIRDCNAAFCTALGHARAELLGRPLADFYTPASRERLAEGGYKQALAGTFGDQERELVTRDGRVIQTLLRAIPESVRDGQVTGTRAMFVDITERKRAEEALAEERALLARRVEERTAELSVANAELARAARLKDEFLAGMSHELRTPLNAILGLSEALQEEIYGPLNDQQRQPLQRIEESGRHLLELINDILDVAKIGAGKIQLEYDSVSIEALCQASLHLIKQQALKKRIAVESTIDPAVTLVDADARRLKQILVNLLSNAVKFTPAGGAIGLAVVGDANRQMVDLTVWDTGIGIEPDDIGRLFQPFVQLDSRLSRQYNGTGLGLTLVARMAELHGGSVSVESEPGAGSRFTVSLPWRVPSERCDAHDVQAPSAANEQPVSLRSPAILLADDNPTSIVMLTDYLEARGYGVLVARDGAEAVARARDSQPAFILMDIQMPGMDGLEAIRRIRTQNDVPYMPIIAVTALAMPGDRERCLAAGADAYLSKPVSLKELAATIDDQLRKATDQGGDHV